MFFNSSLIYCDYNREYYENTIFHSDQGWQYQHQYYHQFLEDKGIQPSMSRKGNSPDKWYDGVLIWHS